MRDTTSERVWSDELPSFLSSSSATSSLKDEQHEDVKILGGNWKKGDACEVAHGVFEYWLHPGRVDFYVLAGLESGLWIWVGPSLKDEVMKIMPVQKQTRAGQRTRFKDFVVVGDSNGYVRLGVKCSKEVATAIRGAIILAKLQGHRKVWGQLAKEQSRAEALSAEVLQLSAQLQQATQAYNGLARLYKPVLRSIESNLLKMKQDGSVMVQ
ncbi:hypothetical protein TEA_008658 [Camellia sinensis var. sinensis]|uniref:S5 DRBM domain-containing protein n=1 Tax=Camellia sinensis var. sinensis TaxID=542762 RepID=A0A4S4F4Z8_CAMSN|nr:hypothetical protein TEA_008658 [Camellia sinensis var. sinensis]